MVMLAPLFKLIFCHLSVKYCYNGIMWIHESVPRYMGISNVHNKQACISATSGTTITTDTEQQPTHHQVKERHRQQTNT